MKALCGAATALTCVGAVVSLAASPAAAGPEPRTLGPSFIYDDSYSKVLTAVTVHATERSTGVTLEASNFPPSAYGRTFGAHVHVDRCGPRPTDAGAHYQRKGKGSLRDRELWLDFTVDEHGRAHVRTDRPWAITPGTANAVVVHSRPTDKGGDAGDPIMCTTVPFHGSGHKDTAAKEPKKAVEKHTKKASEHTKKAKTAKVAKAVKKTDLRTDKKAPASPEPKAEHHAHEHRGHHEHGRDHRHEARGHHEHGREHHEGRDHHEHGRDHHEGREHHEGRDHHEHGRDHHEGRDHDDRDHGHHGHYQQWNPVRWSPLDVVRGHHDDRRDHRSYGR